MMLQGWQSLDSKADISTTTGPILILFAGGCWAQRQLSNAVGYVSVASKLRKSLSSVEVCILGPGGLLLDGRLLHNCWTDFDALCGTLLGSTPAF